MLKPAPLACFGVAAIFLGYAAFQYAGVSAGLAGQPVAAPAVAVGPLQDRPAPAPGPTRPRPGKKPLRETDDWPDGRFIAEMDDLLDTVHDPASFERVKPKLLAVVRQQVAQHAAFAASDPAGA